MVVVRMAGVGQYGFGSAWWGVISRAYLLFYFYFFTDCNMFFASTCGSELQCGP